jgi:hypothetical protein
MSEEQENIKEENDKISSFTQSWINWSNNKYFKEKKKSDSSN